MKIIPYGTAVGMSRTRSLYHFTTIPPFSRAYRRQSCNRSVRVSYCMQGRSWPGGPEVWIPIATTKVTCEILTNPMRKFWGSGREWVPGCPALPPPRLLLFRHLCRGEKRWPFLCKWITCTVSKIYQSRLDFHYRLLVTKEQTSL